MAAPSVDDLTLDGTVYRQPINPAQQPASRHLGASTS
jgi:hypothetical protein